MSFDETNWKFPVADLKAQESVLCLIKSDSGEIECIGGRITCEPLLLPDINEAYQSTRKEKIEIKLTFYFPFTALSEIRGQTLQLGESVEECGEDLGSVYLFGAHNPVGWQSIAFAEAQDDVIEAMVDLYFDFDYEDRIGGAFRHKLPVVFKLERRWEL
jgi:hypothetical protein